MVFRLVVFVVIVPGLMETGFVAAGAWEFPARLVRSAVMGAQGFKSFCFHAVKTLFRSLKPAFLNMVRDVGIDPFQILNFPDTAQFMKLMDPLAHVFLDFSTPGLISRVHGQRPKTKLTPPHYLGFLIILDDQRLVLGGVNCN